MAEYLGWHKIIYGFSARLLKFIINFRTSTLPSPDNLKRWNISHNSKLSLCGSPHVTINHIINGCRWLRAQNSSPIEDRFTWRHNGVFFVFINFIVSLLQKNHSRSFRTHSNKINFVNTGWRKKGLFCHNSYGLLCRSNDWKLCFHLSEYVGQNRIFVLPRYIILSNLKVDLLLLSAKLMIVIFCELTFPNEDNLNKWAKWKTEKYTDMVNHLNNG